MYVLHKACKMYRVKTKTGLIIEIQPKIIIFITTGLNAYFHHVFFGPYQRKNKLLTYTTILCLIHLQLIDFENRLMIFAVCRAKKNCILLINFDLLEFEISPDQH
jgi:hypothetical protein